MALEGDQRTLRLFGADVLSDFTPASLEVEAETNSAHVDTSVPVKRSRALNRSDPYLVTTAQQPIRESHVPRVGLSQARVD